MEPPTKPKITVNMLHLDLVDVSFGDGELGSVVAAALVRGILLSM
jgi:hypothetical protein